MKAKRSSESTVRRLPAVFLDRDGTIIEDCGDLSDPAQVEFFKETFAALRRLTDHFVLFIVTNQSGVAKGTITINDMHHAKNRLSTIITASSSRKKEVIDIRAAFGWKLVSERNAKAAAVANI